MQLRPPSPGCSRQMREINVGISYKIFVFPLSEQLNW